MACATRPWPLLSGALPSYRADETSCGPSKGRKETSVATYRMVYGDDDQIVTETYENVEVEREDGWVVVFRDGDAIVRVREEHVRSLDEVLLDAVRHGLALPIHQHVVGVVASEHAVPVGVVPSGEVKVVHALEVGGDVVIVH